MKKVLIVTSVASMVDQFLMNDIHTLKETGYEIHIAANFKRGNTSSKEKIISLKKRLEEIDVRYYDINFARNVFNLFENFSGYLALSNIMSKNNFEFVHCHSPIGGVIGRIVSKKYRTPSIYTAHGFHFFKGSSFKNWLFYFPVEYLLSKITNKIITINEEDFGNASKFFDRNKIEFVNGIGVNLEEINSLNTSRSAMRKQLMIDENCFLLLSVGELNKNKNHEIIIRSLFYLKDYDIQYAICGKGPLKESLVRLADELGVRDKVHFLGFRQDVKKIYVSADAYVFPSLREGLSVALMEAMASSLPVICSGIRGNVDLIQQERGGILIQNNDSKHYIEAILKMYMDDSFRVECGKFNKEYIKKYDINITKKSMRKIYSEIK
ncbi:glycosyltransferase [Exiguobacterium sp. SH4S7]|uniref:glycosyltransferase n=1 Tax=Exiguobacterium sp. SH4S7 TaxID=2510958 RepID=UPI001375B6EB|nr:glycosyltransferase [Exiguobacterium sp. SH4S7]